MIALLNKAQQEQIIDYLTQLFGKTKTHLCYLRAYGT